jgi:hypothetical protein
MFNYIAQKNIEKWLKISTAYMAYGQIRQNDGHFGRIKKLNYHMNKQDKTLKYPITSFVWSSTIDLLPIQDWIAWFE